MLAILFNPQVIAGVITLIGVIAGWYVKHWAEEQAAKQAQIDLQKHDETAVQKSAQAGTTGTAGVNQSIDKQDQAADDWFKKP